MAERKLKALLLIFVVTNVVTALCLSARIRASYAQEDAWKTVNDEFVTVSGFGQAVADFREGRVRLYEVPLPSVKKPAVGAISKSPDGLPVWYWTHDLLTKLDTEAGESFVRSYNARMRSLVGQAEAERAATKWAVLLKKMESDESSAKARSLTGPGEIDCGLIDGSEVGATRRDKENQILALIKARKPFRARFYYYGMPTSQLNIVLAGDSQGKIFLIHPNGTPISSGIPHETVPKNQDVQFSLGGQSVKCRMVGAG